MLEMVNSLLLMGDRILQTPAQQIKPANQGQLRFCCASLVLLTFPAQSKSMDRLTVLKLIYQSPRALITGDQAS